MSYKYREIDLRILQTLASEAGAVGIDRLAGLLDLDQSPVAAAATILAEQGLLTLTEESEEELRLGTRAEGWAGGACPERRVARALAQVGGRSGIKELPARSGLEQKDVGQALRWLAARSWAFKERGELVQGEAWGREEAPLAADEALVAALSAGSPARRSDLVAQGVAVDAGLALLSKRPGIVDVKVRRRRLAELSSAGREALAKGIHSVEDVNELTTGLLVSGRWKDVDFRPYDVTLPGREARQGKEHPFRRVLEDTRRAFLFMGFEETASPWVESAFWDFDALFQPQDHPARDMQDTFYVGRPDRCRLPADELVERVARTHENGGDTASLGWRYSWKRSLAERCVLRTHTTAATIRELAREPKPPRKVFCVGPVFRRETIDYKHLPVFHQVDGIVIDEKASFSALLTLLGTFYKKMGFERIQFRPAFFPYTEPSVEVFVWLESRSDWVEMGGAGVFRPEVTEPLGCREPVLAWGLGLERLAMFRYKLSDIREIYLSHLDWLEEVPQCRS